MIVITMITIMIIIMTAIMIIIMITILIIIIMIINDDSANNKYKTAEKYILIMTNDNSVRTRSFCSRETFT